MILEHIFIFYIHRLFSLNSKTNSRNMDKKKKKRDQKNRSRYGHIFFHLRSTSYFLHSLTFFSHFQTNSHAGEIPSRQIFHNLVIKIFLDTFFSSMLNELFSTEHTLKKVILRHQKLIIMAKKRARFFRARFDTTLIISFIL